MEELRPPIAPDEEQGEEHGQEEDRAQQGDDRAPSDDEESRCREGGGHDNVVDR